MPIKKCPDDTCVDGWLFKVDELISGDLIRYLGCALVSYIGGSAGLDQRDVICV
ncbi:MAG: hypothetical protein ABW185_05250 [Sedimenticola sp.]